MGLSVLIVDDDAAFLDLTARVLGKLGVERIVTAPDARRALAEAEAWRPAAMLVDVGLPDRRGTELAQELAQLPWRPHVVLTSSDSDAVHAIEPHADDATIIFVPKEELTGDVLRHALLGG